MIRDSKYVTHDVRFHTWELDMKMQSSKKTRFFKNLAKKVLRNKRGSN